MDYYLLRTRLTQAIALRLRPVLTHEKALQLSWSTARRRNARRAHRCLVPDVVIDFGSGRSAKDVHIETGDWRYLFRLVQVFGETGHAVCIRMPLSEEMYSKEDSYRRLVRFPRVHVASRVPLGHPEQTIYICSQQNERPIHANWKRRLALSFKVNSVNSDQGQPLIVPFGLHPRLAKSSLRASWRPLRDGERRRMRLLFGGSAGMAYEHPVWTLSMTRNALLRILIQRRSPDRLRTVDNLQAYNRAFASKAPYDKQTVFLQQRRPQREWLHCLSRADFFLCLPGYRMPMCHNAIEAMAVGTIPLICYPEWFCPPLEHLKNCVIFKTPEDMLEKIDLIEAMDAESIASLRQGVIDYYEANLSAESFVSRLTAHLDVTTLYVISEACHNLQGLGPESVLFNPQDRVPALQGMERVFE